MFNIRLKCFKVGSILNNSDLLGNNIEILFEYQVRRTFATKIILKEIQGCWVLLNTNIFSCSIKHEKVQSSLFYQGEDLRLMLEGEILKLVHPETKHVIHSQPIAKMRVWGVGREGEEKR